MLNKFIPPDVNSSLENTLQILVNFTADDGDGLDSVWYYNGSMNKTLTLTEEDFNRTVNAGQTATLNCSAGNVIINFRISIKIFRQL